MSKKIIKFFCLALALLMLGSTFMSCNRKDTDGEVTTASTTVPETNLHQALGMEIRDYTGQQMKVWYSNQDGNKWSPYPLDVKVEDTETDIIYKAGYKRNQEMKERIGIEMVYTINNDNPINDATPLRLLRQSGDIKNYDLTLVQNQRAGELALEGFFVDLSLSPHINTNEYYYENSINDQMKLGQKQYFAMGYYSWSNTAATDMTYANMEILENEAQVTKEHLYDLALNNKFTMAKMLEYGRAHVQPETGNTDYKTAKVAYLHSYNYAANLFFNLGGEVVRYNSGQNTYDIVIKEKKNIDILTYIRDNVTNSTESIMVKEDKHNDAYMLGCAPFVVQHNYFIEDLTANAIVDKTIFLPPPVLNEGDEYRAFCHSWNLTVAGIPIDTAVDPQKFDKAGYLYEFFMIACYEIVYPAFYEDTFKTRYQPDETSRAVFDLCQSSKVIDIAYAYDLYGTVNVSSAVREGSSPSTTTSQMHQAISASLKSKGLGDLLG